MVSKAIEQILDFEEDTRLASRDPLVREWNIEILDQIVQNLIAEIDAFVADVDTRTGNKFADLVLRFAAERALEVGVKLWHWQGCPRSRIDLGTGFLSQSFRVKSGL